MCGKNGLALSHADHIQSAASSTLRGEFIQTPNLLQSDMVEAFCANRFLSGHLFPMNLIHA